MVDNRIARQFAAISDLRVIRGTELEKVPQCRVSLLAVSSYILEARGVTKALASYI
jgi:hypothetical protein